MEFFVVETPFYMQAAYIHSANWCEDWVLWLGEGHSVVPFRSGDKWRTNKLSISLNKRGNTVVKIKVLIVNW
jgi:hypothetical protein